MIGILLGVAIAAYGKAKFDSWGVLLQLGAVAFEATRLVLIQILLTSKGITLNPITTLYYVAPCCLLLLIDPWLFVEFPVLKETSTFHFDYFIFGINSLCAFALNLAVYRKDFSFDNECGWCCQGLASHCLLMVDYQGHSDTSQFARLWACVLGVCYYNHSKLQALKLKEAKKKSAHER